MPYGGADPATHHLLLVIAHLFASFGLVVLFRELGADLEVSLIASFLFLVGVSHVQAVQWIACVAYPIALALTSVCGGCFARYAKTRQRRWLAYCLVAIALSVLTHPASCMAAVFCVYLAWRNPAWRRVVAVAVTVAGGIWYLYPAAPQTRDLSDTFDPIGFLHVFAGYLGKLLSHAHWLPQDLFGNAAWQPGGPADRLVGLSVAAALAAFAWRGPRPLAGFAVWTAIMLLPFTVQQEQGSRYLYFASVGSSLVIAWSLRAAVTMTSGWLSINARRWLYAGSLALIGAISVISARRAEVLEFYYSGRSHIARGAPEIGIAQLQRGLARDSNILPDDVYWRLSLVAFQHGQSPRDDLQRAVDSGRGSPEVLALLGADSFLSGDGEIRSRGVGLVRQAIQADNGGDARATAATAYHNIGTFYLNQSKDSEQAVLLFNRALALRPSYLKARFHLGNAFFLGGRTDEAIDAYRQIISDFPHCSEAYQNLATAHWASGQTADAIRTLQAGVAHNPDARPLRDLLSRFTRGNV